MSVCVSVKRVSVSRRKESVLKNKKKYSKENVKHTVNFSVILLIFVDIIFLLLFSI